MPVDLTRKSYEAIGGCWGLVREVNRRVGRELPAWENICAADAAAEIAARREHFTRVDQPQRGDIVHIKAYGGSEHVGVVIETGVILQATRRHGVHRMRLDHPWLKDRILGFYQFKETSWA